MQLSGASFRGSVLYYGILRTMYSLLIGICTGGTVRSETVTSLIGAIDVLKSKGIDTNLAIQVGGYVAHNRNYLVRTALEKQSTHLMFIDNDMTFLPSSIQRLVDHDKDIVAANYNTRGNTTSQGDLINVLKPLDEKGNMILDGKSQRIEIPPTLFKVAGIGTGFMLIKMSVFEKLEKPYFVAWESEVGEHHTEDIEFCIKAREVGFDVWCSPTIRVGHIGTMEY